MTNLILSDKRERVASALGGGLAFVADAALFNVLLLLASPATSAAAGVFAGGVTCFLFNRHVAFRRAGRPALAEAGRFAVIVLISSILTAALVPVGISVGLPALVAKLLTALLLFAVWTYPAQKLFVFAAAPSQR